LGKSSISQESDREEEGAFHRSFLRPGKRKRRFGVKKACLFVLSAVMVMGLSAQGNDHNVSFGVSLGLLDGQGEEIIYRNESGNNKLSQLLWDIKPLFYAGVDMAYSWQKPENIWGIFADTSFKFGFPGRTGVIEDRDWMVLAYPEFLTHYSVHDNKTESAMLIDANIGVSFRIFKIFLLKTYIAYSFMRFSWTANGGSFLYPASDGGHGYLRPIDVVAYKQTWNTISPGVAFYGEFNRYFDLEISLALSPFIWCFAEDNHILRDLKITGNANGGFFIEPGLVFSFKPAKYFAASFTFKYRNISGTRGNAEYVEQGQPSFTARNMSGVAYSAFDIGLIGKFRISL
jgi:outer membrane protease